MKKELFGAIIAIAMAAGVVPALAEEDIVCLKCHEPADDWEGMTAEEILVDARDPDNKRHKSIQELSDEQLNAIIATLAEE